MVSTGSEFLDKTFKYENKLYCIYGKPSTGKTNLCLTATAKNAEDKKIMFIDTENSFNIERLHQLNSQESIFNNIILSRAKSIFQQSRIINNFEDKKIPLGLLVIDSLTHHYRISLKKDPRYSNLMLNKQLRILKNISTHFPVLVTSQVYTNLEGETIPMGYQFLARHCDVLIKLENDDSKRTLTYYERPFKKSKFSLNFRITNEGVAKFINQEP